MTIEWKIRMIIRLLDITYKYVIIQLYCLSILDCIYHVLRLSYEDICALKGRLWIYFGGPAMKAEKLNTSKFDGFLLCVGCLILNPLLYLTELVLIAIAFIIALFSIFKDDICKR